MKKSPFNLCAHIWADLDRWEAGYNRFHNQQRAHGSFPQRAVRSDEKGKATLE